MKHFEDRLRQYSSGPHALGGSEETNLPTVLTETVSGKYIELEREGKLAGLVKLQRKREQLRFDLSAAAQLIQAHNRILRQELTPSTNYQGRALSL